MSPAGKNRTKKFVTKVKNAGFWQRFNRRGGVSNSHGSSKGKSDTRELRGHEHPKEPERNKK